MTRLPSLISKDSCVYYYSDTNHLDVPSTYDTHMDSLVTVLSTTNIGSEFHLIESCISAMIDGDDVYSDDFLDEIFIQYTDEVVLGNLGSTRSCNVMGQTTSLTWIPRPENLWIASGPYIKTRTGFKRAWKLFEDTQNAFESAIVPETHGSSRFTNPNFPHLNGRLSIAVPSRLHYMRTDDRPLSGMRVAVKDTINVSGLPTGCGSKSFQKLYPMQDVNAVCIQKLIQLGAILIGKTKTAQFADGDTLTSDWVESSCPINPRGDGYLIPSGSSSGSASAIAAYGWLDVAIGTDTVGSIRGPAMWQGVYGLRPSYGLVSCEGVFPTAKSLDTVGFFTRDLQTCKLFSEHWLDEAFRPNSMQQPNTTSNSTFTQLLYPTDEYNLGPRCIQDCNERFILAIEHVLEVRRTDIHLAKSWATSGLSEGDIALHDYLDTVIRDIKIPQQERFFATFEDSYVEAFEQRPYFNLVIRSLRDIAKTLPRDQEDSGLARQATFSSWLQTVMLPSHSYFGNLLVLPMTDGKLTYRDEYCSEPIGVCTNGWHTKLISSLGGMPQLVIPIGEYAFRSKVTGRTAYLPITVSLVASKGKERHLVHLASLALHSCGMATGVMTGRRCFNDVFPS